MIEFLPKTLDGEFAKNLEPECSLEDARTRIDYWQRGGDSFGCRIFELLGKADLNNRLRLQIAFPIHYQAWFEWQSNPTTPARGGLG